MSCSPSISPKARSVSRCAGAGGSLASTRKAIRTSRAGIAARPIVWCQPICSAIRGASSAHATVPELPAPAMPIASPWWCGGYQREASGSEIANEAPATPSRMPTPSSSDGEFAPSQPHSSGTSVSSIEIVPTRRGPKRSASTPKVTRANAALSSGTATSTPFCDADRPEILGDVGAERAQDDPDREGDVEMQKRGDERRRVARAAEVGHAHDRMNRPSAAVLQCGSRAISATARSSRADSGPASTHA